MLLTFLTYFGNAVGRDPHLLVSGDEHPGRLNVCLVGDSSRSRKGTSEAHIRKLLELADASWSDECILQGLSTGEGLISAVRDRKADDDEETPTDKRLLVVEPEFGRVLTVAGREGSTLSAVIRQAWDGTRLGVMTRHEPLKAGSDHHISILGHITQRELLEKLTTTDMANGFANRFLFALVHRSKLLPDGGSLTTDALSELASKTRKALLDANKVEVMQRSDRGAKLWDTTYRELETTEHGGLAGALTARSSAQVLRLSVLYALLDSSEVIKPRHIRAALAVWNYCEASVLSIFADRLGDQAAERLYEAIRAAGRAGLTGTDQNKALSGHVNTVRLEQLRGELEAAHRVITVKEPTRGRSRVRSWAAPYAPAEDAEKAEEGQDPGSDEVRPMVLTTSALAREVPSVPVVPAAIPGQRRLRRVR